MIPFLAPKSQYTELEAAQQLGISVERLRSLVRQEVGEDDPAEMRARVFQAADVIALWFLVQSESKAA